MVKAKRKRIKKVNHISMFHPFPLNEMTPVLAGDIVELRSDVYIRVIEFGREECAFDGEFILDIKDKDGKSEEIMNDCLDAYNHIPDSSKNAMLQLIAHVEHLFPTANDFIQEEVERYKNKRKI